jgi:hypothetical protein
MPVNKRKKVIQPYRVVNIYPELTAEEREKAKKEVARRIYNVLVKKA